VTMCVALTRGRQKCGCGERQTSTLSDEVLLHSEHQHAGGSLNRTVNPGRVSTPFRSLVHFLTPEPVAHALVRAVSRLSRHLLPNAVVSDARGVPESVPHLKGSLMLRGIGRATRGLNSELPGILGVQSLPAAELHGIGADHAADGSSAQKAIQNIEGYVPPGRAH
jgi:hypothetical protein